MCHDSQAQIPGGIEFQTERAATLKTREGEAKPTTDWCWRSIQNRLQNAKFVSIFVQLGQIVWLNEN